MKKLNQAGEISGLLISTIMLALLFIGTSVFLVMTYGNYTDARDNVDAKVSTAVDDAKTKQKAALEVDFAEKEKNPLRAYESSAAFGSIKVMFPKTWSAYVDESDSAVPINGFFHPDFVPSQAKKIKYAVRLQLKNAKYADSIMIYKEKVDRGDFKAAPIVISGETGTRYDGKIDQDTTGALVAIPIRDKTLLLWTESNDYIADFNDIILKNLSFSK